MSPANAQFPRAFRKNEEHDVAALVDDWRDAQ
jgi:hypothetical protein